MRKTRKSSLMILVVTLFMLIVGAVSVVSSAATTSSPAISIEKFNLSFDNNVFIKFAVKIDGVDDRLVTEESIGMLYWTDASGEFAPGTEKSTSRTVGHQTIGGVKHYVFEYTEFAAKQMVDDVYCRAYIEIDGEYYYSDTVKYSILRYASDRLGYTGTATNSKELREMLANMLNYGASAQKYFGYKVSRLANARFYEIKLDGGTFSDGFDKALFAPGESVEISAPLFNEKGDMFFAWVAEDGRIISRDSDFVVTAENRNQVFVAKYTTNVESIECEHDASVIEYEEEFCNDIQVCSVYCGKCGEFICSYGHNYETTVTAATCIANGSEDTVCKNCGDSYSRVLPQVDHIMGKTVVVKESSCVELGEEQRVCVICETYSETNVIPKKDHTYTSTETETHWVKECVCGDRQEIEKENVCKVFFVSEGIDIPAQAVVLGGVVDLPIPEREGYVFAGWYYDELCEIYYDLETVNEDITLYAKWYEIITTEPESTHEVLTDLDRNFAFAVESETILTNQNINDYVIITDTTEKQLTVKILSQSDNAYIISCDEYESGCQYVVALADGVSFVEYSCDELWLAFEGNIETTVVLKPGVKTADVASIYGFVENGTDLVMLSTVNTYIAGDIVVFYDGDVEDYQFGLKIINVGTMNGLVAYDVEIAEIEEFCVEVSAGYNENVDFSESVVDPEFEAQVIEQFINSDLYAQYVYAAESTAATYGQTVSDIGISVNTATDKNGNLVINLTARAKMPVSEKGTKVVFSFENTMILKSDIIYEARGLKSTLLLSSEVENTVRVDAYFEGTEPEENLSELSIDELTAKYRSVFKSIAEGNIIIRPDKLKSVAKKNIKVTTLPFKYGVFSASVGISIQLEFNVVGGFELENTSTVSTQVGLRNGTIVFENNFKNDGIVGYIFARTEVFGGVKFELAAGVLGLTGYINACVGPYVRVGGAGASSSTAYGGISEGQFFVSIGIKASAGGGFYYGVEVFGFSAKIKIIDAPFGSGEWEFFSYGDSVIDYCFEEDSHSNMNNPYKITVDCEVGSVSNISLADLISRDCIALDMNSLQATTKEVKCKFFVEDLPEGWIVSLTNGYEVKFVKGELTPFVVKIRVENMNRVYKYVYLEVSFTHKEVETIPASEATCIQAGHDEYVRCVRCLAVVEGEYNPEFADHDFTNELTFDITRRFYATCTEPETFYYSCMNCQEISPDKYFGVGDPLGHKPDEEIVIDEIGHWYECLRENCGEKVSYGLHNANGADATENNLVSVANCQSPAVYYCFCTDCGYNSKETFVYGEIGTHIYADEFTCHDRKCNFCDHIEVATTGHIFSEWIDVPSDECSAFDYSMRACRDCGFIETDGREGDVMHHNTVVEDVYPTCTEEGYYKIYCIDCGKVFKESTSEPFGHSYNSYKMASDMEYHWNVCTRLGCGYEDKSTKVRHSGGRATCIEQAVCDVCEKAYGYYGYHSYAGEIVEYATCTTPMLVRIICEECGFSPYYIYHGSPLGHAVGEYSYDGEYHWYTCQREGCGKTITEKHSGGSPTCVSLAECRSCHQSYGDYRSYHVYGEKAESEYLKSAATCISLAEYYYSCVDCGENEKNDNHTFLSGTKAAHTGGTATCMSPAKCSVCGKLYGEKDPNNHTKSDEWYSDGVYHYKKCENGCDKKLEKGEHRRSGNEELNCLTRATCEICHHKYGLTGAHKPVERIEEKYLKSVATCTTPAVYYSTCTVCHKYVGTFYVGGVDPSNHSISLKWENSSTHHWKKCLNGCGEVFEKGEHEGGEATCEKSAKCDVCQKYYGEALGHNPSETWENDATYHWKKCLNGCDEKIDFSRHNYESATCVSSAYCKDCGITRGEKDPNNHNESAVWSSDESNHWKDCLNGCGEKLDIANHKGVATCVSSAYCNICENYYGEKNPNGHDYDYEATESQHRVVCGYGCGYKAEWENHAETKPATCETGKYCGVCHSYYGDSLGHDLIYDYDQTQHWKKCNNCDYTESLGEHMSSDKATCMARATCDVCEQEFGSFGDHNRKYTKIDDKEHFVNCITEGCSYQNKESHEETTASSCFSLAYCGKCEESYGNYQEHSPKYRKYNEQQHIQECTTSGCNYKKEPVSHNEAKEATCVAQSYCDICNSYYGEKNLDNHSIGWKSDETHHWRACQRLGCSYVVPNTKVEHTSDKATCVDYDNCDVCRKSYKDPDNHVIGWASDETHHWEECTLGCGYSEQENKAEHTSDGATCLDYDNCDVCERSYKKSHQIGWESDNTYHWKECKLGCGHIEPNTKGVHVSDEATCVDFADCEICGKSFKDPDNHQMDWDGNETQHWKECKRPGCDYNEKDKAEAHYGGVATCTERKKCIKCSSYYGEYGTHDYQNRPIVAAEASKATCEEPAKYYRSCSKCDAVEGDPNNVFSNGEKLGHWPENDTFYRDDVEGEAGEHWQICSRCRKEISKKNYEEPKDNEIYQLGRAKHVITEATCTTKAKCGECEYEYGEFAEHIYDQEIPEEKYVRTKATCKEYGVYYKSCICGEFRADEDKTFSVEEYGAHDYEGVEGEITLEPTCTTKGIEVKICNVCKEAEELTVDPLNHLPSENYFNDATHHWQRCEREGCVDADMINLTEHDGEATCTKPAICSVCKKLYADALGHNYSDEYSYDNYYHYHKCTNGDCKSIKPGSIVSHTLTAYCKTQTVSQGDISTTTIRIFEKCDICGYDRMISEHKDVMHEGYEYIPPVPPTCTKSGMTSGVKCSVEGCGCKTTPPVEIPAHGHNFVNCECTICGYSLHSDDHEMTAWTVLAIKTCEYDGYRERTCLDCGYLESERTEAEGHKWENVVDDKYLVDEPDCLMPYIYYQSCSVCGEASNQGFSTGLKQHDLINESVKVEPTCVYQGYGIGTCHWCDAEISYPIPTVDHRYENGKCIWCGIIKYSEGLDFTSNGDGTCYVSGIGSCKDKYVNIPSASPAGDKVVGIGNNAFYHTTIVSVVIPDGVTTIGIWAFWNCEDLISVVIPDTVSVIKRDAFESCVNLTSITIPDSVKVIESSAFTECDALTIYCEAVEQPSGWDNSWNENNHINNGYCPIVWNCLNNEVAHDGYIYAVIDGIRYALKDGIAEVAGQPKNITTANIPSSVAYKDVCYNVISIRAYAFERCNELRSVIIPNGVTSIGAYAFSDCSLESVTIPDSVTSIGAYAFSDCSLESVTIPDSVTSIGVCAFSWCDRLENIFVDESNPVYKDIDGNLYTKDGKTIIQYARGKAETSFDIPEGVTTIGTYAFEHSELSYVNIPYSVTSIEEYAFWGSDLIGVLIPGSVVSIGERSFYACYELEYITLENGIESIGKLAFGACSLIESITIPHSVTSIADKAFWSCDNLEAVILPNSILTVGASVFSDCYSLAFVYYEGSKTEWRYVNVGSSGNTALINSLYYYSASMPTEEGNFWFYEYGVPKIWSSDISLEFTSNGDGTCYVSGIGNYTAEYVVIPETSPKGDIVTGIGRGAFENCHFVKGISIPKTVVEIESASMGMGLDNLGSITVAEDNEVYKSIDGTLYTKDGTVLLRYAPGKTGNPFVVPDSVNEIGNLAFYGCINLWEIVLTENITTIGARAFELSGLSTITVPASVTKLGGRAFYECYTLQSATILAQIEDLGKSTFGYCRNIKSVVLPDGLKTIGEGAFIECEDLVSIDIPDGVTTIEKTAFGGCYRLEYIAIPESVTIIAERAFSSNIALKHISIGSGVENIGNGAFEGCAALADVYYNGTEAKWESITVDAGNNYLLNANIHFNFYGPTSSAGLEFTSNGDGTCYVSGIGTCNDTVIVIPKTSPEGDIVTSIGDYAFQRCHSIVSVVIPDGVMSIGDYAFDYCNRLVRVVIPDSVKRIGNHAFNECEVLSMVEIPDGVEIIGDYAFLNSHGFTSVFIPDSVISIGEGAFGYCINLSRIEVSENNTAYRSIDGNLYTKDGKILIQYAIGKSDDSFTIPDGVNSIAEWAFYWCTNLTRVEISNSVEIIDDYAFYLCNNLINVVIGNNVKVIGDYAFGLCDDLADVVIPDSVTSIGASAFYDCASLTSVVIPDSVTHIGEQAFVGCDRLTSIEVAENNTAYRSIDGNLYTKDGKTLIQYAVGKSDAYFSIPDGVETIGNFAFRGCDSLISVVIPDSVKIIGDSAFRLCGGLESVEIGDGVEVIGDSAFGMCFGLTSVEISDSVKTIGDSAFVDCWELTSVVIENGVETIGDSAFDTCYGLENVYYNGTKAEWEAIDIGDGNRYLLSANIHFIACSENHNLNGEIIDTSAVLDLSTPGINLFAGQNVTCDGRIYDGYFACEECGYIVPIKVKATHGASTEWVTTKEPTCTENGEKILVCQWCGERVGDDVQIIEPLGHAIQLTVSGDCSEIGDTCILSSVCVREGCGYDLEEEGTLVSIVRESEATCYCYGTLLYTCVKANGEELQIKVYDGELLPHTLNGEPVDSETILSHNTPGIHLFAGEEWVCEKVIDCWFECEVCREANAEDPSIPTIVHTQAIRHHEYSSEGNCTHCGARNPELPPDVDDGGWDNPDPDDGGWV